VFVDECSTNIALTRLYARAPKGGRAFGKAPRNWGKNITLIASLSTEGVGAAMSVEGATDGAAFETYVKHFLAPTLKGGQVVVMDNLRVHKSARVGGLIEDTGAEVLFLPPYSPDFSPIEEAFSKVKGIPCAGSGPAPAKPSDGSDRPGARCREPAGCRGLVRAPRLQRRPSLAMKSALGGAKLHYVNRG
jgi:transposase